uniref:Guanylate cyclase n=1 Tax=Strongyloides papillosus TaxID=174720 RepID=A0A0N5BNP6_STREA
MFCIFILIFNFALTTKSTTNVAFLRNDPNVSVACTVGIDHASSSGQCQNDISLKIGAACETSNNALGTVNACEYVYNENAKIIVGPGCFDEDSQITVLSKHWKVPFFSRSGNVWTNYNNTVYPNTIHVSFSNVIQYADSLKKFMDKFNLTSVCFVGPRERTNFHYQSLHVSVNNYFKTFFNNITTNAILIDESQLSSFSPSDSGLIGYIKLIVIDAGFDNLKNVLQEMEIPDLYRNGYVFIILCYQHSTVCGSNIGQFMSDYSIVLLSPYFENYTNIDLLMSQYFKDSYNRYRGVEYLGAYISCYASCMVTKLDKTLDGISVTNIMKGKQINSLLGNYAFDQMPSILVTQSFSQYIGANNSFIDLILTKPITTNCEKNKCFQLELVVNNDVFWHSQLESPLTHCYLTKSCINYLVIIICVVAAVAFLVIVSLIYMVRRQRHLNVYRMNWKIPKNQFKVIENKVSNSKNKQGNTTETLSSKRRYIHAYAIVETTKAEFLQLRQLKKIVWSKPEIKFITELKKMSHDNLTNFLGVNYNDSEKFYVLSTLTDRASLEDLVDDPEFTLDMTFKSAFIRDILKGLQYLHKSYVGYHGLLNIQTCLIDANWVLKLSNFGITNILHNLIRDEVLKNIELINLHFYQTISPENLQGCNFGINYPMGTPTGDIYSFGIILFRLTYRYGPFDGVNMVPKDILKGIVNNTIQPVYEETLEENSLLDLMKNCLKYNPLERPTLKVLESSIRTILHSTRSNLVDQMININEKYAQNLERVVAERTNLLIEAQQQTDRLLSEMLPPSIAETLKNGGTVEPKLYESATVCFVQIWEFAKFMEENSPPEVVQFLNDVFNMFDEVISSHDCYKVETIGDTYMVVSGVPKENEGKHVFVIAEVALSLRSHSLHFKVPVKPDWKLTIRIGFHCGPIAAGIIGLKAPRYCLFGDTVNFSSRMESNCPPNQIQVSEPTALKLMENPEYRLIKRGIVKVKGKGDVNTYWLNEHFHHGEPPPDPKPNEN